MECIGSTTVSKHYQLSTKRHTRLSVHHFSNCQWSGKQTGKNVFIVFYEKHYQQGNGRFLEVAVNSKADFEREFGNNYINTSSWDYLEQSKSWDKLANMQWRNKFAVANTGLDGK